MVVILLVQARQAEPPGQAVPGLRLRQLYVVADLVELQRPSLAACGICVPAVAPVVGEGDAARFWIVRQGRQ